MKFRTLEMTGFVEPGATPPEVLVRRAWPHHRRAFAMPEGVSRGEVAYAAVNHGRWVVRCPFCPGAQLASDGDRRFACIDCLHDGTAAAGRWLRVVWPPNRAAIETALARRPRPEVMNWAPGETIAQLERETRMHAEAAARWADVLQAREVSA